VGEYTFKLGPSAAKLGLSILHSLPIGRLALEPLRELRDLTGHTASLAILSATDTVYVNRVRGHREGQHEVDLELRAGARLTAHHTAAGKLLLANLPEAERDAVIADLQFNPLTPNSIVDEQTLRSALMEIRSVALAFSEEELTIGMRAISAAVCDRGGNTLAAVELAAPTHSQTADEFIREFSAPLLLCCSEISDLLRTAPPTGFSESGGDDERTHAMYALYQQGATFEQVGERFGLPHDHVRELFKSSGLHTG
jgi:IclR family pca regulon transcriptional regulator